MGFYFDAAGTVSCKRCLLRPAETFLITDVFMDAAPPDAAKSSKKALKKSLRTIKSYSHNIFLFLIFILFGTVFFQGGFIKVISHTVHYNDYRKVLYLQPADSFSAQIFISYHL